MRSSSCLDFRRGGWSRRDLLRVGSLGMLGVSLPRFLRAAEGNSGRKARAQSVIFLHQFGGPSHLDTFDLKPDAPEAIRGEFRPIATSAPGVFISERLPRLAQVMDKVCLVRSLHHDMKTHNAASYYSLTGHAPPLDDIRLRDTLDLFPAYGSVVDRLAPARFPMPTFVSFPYVLRDGSITPGQHASFLGKTHDPFFVGQDPNSPDFGLPELRLPARLTPERLENRREMLRLIDRQTELLDWSARARNLEASYEKALGMLTSPAVKKAFDLAAEPPAVRDRYGRTTYGQSCLLARRLVEAGVRFVNVYLSGSIGGRMNSGGWDTHGFDNNPMYPILKSYLLPLTDQVLPVLLRDLDERGLLDQTLVVWMGEFGRSPRINNTAGRDHWPQCYTALLAGGGLKRGYVHGSSDRTGAYPAADAVKPDDLAATMFALLGIDPRTEVYDPLNRPLPIAAGEPISGLLA
ncbi:MAG: DUF1501 domain-containing protein [Gemmataceae bacterium]|nr:DUF1501 domain-containing protein [Gemmataceae bacterium]MDW8264593.1 DUF1501 domain-containing protein [Gemmataceae bacterium]